MRVQIYDTTLRDGSQSEGISFSVEDKLHIAAKLDELGVQFIEGGWPGSNPKDAEFFERARELKLANSVLTAFGSTRRANIEAEADANLLALENAGVKVVTIVGKSSEPQVTQVLETTLEENLRMVADSIRYLKSKGLRVIFDAEHFFDGYKADAPYALRVIEIASEAGAECLVLCDTNGGTLPHEIVSAIEAVKKVTRMPLGIHTHNDSELAVANSLAAVMAGVTHVQGTVNGYGERCGNANLCSIIPSLKIKMGIDCITDDQLARITSISRYISEIANLAPQPFAPYVGASAFAHKGGVHASGMSRWDKAYQHIDPARVGNQARITVSELSGRSNIVAKAREKGLKFSARGQEVTNLLEQIKLQESRGFQYEHAEASLELLLERVKAGYRPPFELVDFLVVVEAKRRAPTKKKELHQTLSEATIKVRVGGDVIHTAAEGNGPVNALDQALRKALVQFFPSLATIRLVDYKVRILEEGAGTESQVRVLIEFSDGGINWRTVGSSTNIIEASWLALADSMEYWLLRQKKA